MINLNLLKTSVALVMACAMSLSFAQQGGGGSPGAQPAAAWKYKTAKLNRAQVDALLAKPEQLVIIDLRRPDELTKIGGFPVYLSIQSADLEKSLPFIPRDRAVLTASNHAGRGGAAADLLAAKGFKVAGTVGVQNYEEEGGKLTRIAVPAPRPTDAGPAVAR
jgi:rhodanese-related sulfurtransferase